MTTTTTTTTITSTSCEVTANVFCAQSENPHYFFLTETFNGLKWKAAFLEKPDKDVTKCGGEFRQCDSIVKLRYEANAFSKQSSCKEVFVRVLLNSTEKRGLSIASEIIRIALSPKAASKGFESKPVYIMLCDVHFFKPIYKFINDQHQIKITVIISTDCAHFHAARFEEFKLYKDYVYYVSIEISKIQESHNRAFNVIANGRYDDACKIVDGCLIEFPHIDQSHKYMLETTLEYFQLKRFEASIKGVKLRRDEALRNNNPVELGNVSTTFFKHGLFNLALTVALEAQERAGRAQDIETLMKMDVIISRCLVYADVNLKELLRDAPPDDKDLSQIWALPPPCPIQATKSIVAYSDGGKADSETNKCLNLENSQLDDAANKYKYQKTFLVAHARLEWWLNAGINFSKLGRYTDAISLLTRIISSTVSIEKFESDFRRVKCAILRCRALCYGQTGQIELELKDRLALADLAPMEHDHLAAQMALIRYYFLNKEYVECRELCNSVTFQTVFQSEDLEIVEILRQISLIIGPSLNKSSPMKVPSNAAKVDLICEKDISCDNAVFFECLGGDTHTHKGEKDVGDDSDKDIDANPESSTSIAIATTEVCQKSVICLPTLGLEDGWGRVSPELEVETVDDVVTAVNPPSGVGDFNLEEMNSLPPAEYQNYIGEYLYSKISLIDPHRAGKITDMLLEMDISALLHLLQSSSPNLLKEKIDDTIARDIAGPPQTATLNFAHMDSPLPPSLPPSPPPPNGDNYGLNTSLEIEYTNYDHQVNQYNGKQLAMESKPPPYYIYSPEPTLAPNSDVIYFCPVTFERLGRFVAVPGLFECSYQVYDFILDPPVVINYDSYFEEKILCSEGEETEEEDLLVYYQEHVQEHAQQGQHCYVDEEVQYQNGCYANGFLSRNTNTFHAPPRNHYSSGTPYEHGNENYGNNWSGQYNPASSISGRYNPLPAQLPGAMSKYTSPSLPISQYQYGTAQYLNQYPYSTSTPTNNNINNPNYGRSYHYQRAAPPAHQLN